MEQTGKAGRFTWRFEVLKIRWPAAHPGVVIRKG
jgi:hypothetical protein